jgi:hypothetical protein
MLCYVVHVPGTYINLGVSLKALGRVGEAIDVYQRATLLPSPMPQVGARPTVLPADNPPHPGQTPSWSNLLLLL